MEQFEVVPSTRPIDELGRIILPVEVRRKLNLDTGDIIDLFIIENNTLCLKKSIETCCSCGLPHSLVKMEIEREDKPPLTRNICESCIRLATDTQQVTAE